MRNWGLILGFLHKQIVSVDLSFIKMKKTEGAVNLGRTQVHIKFEMSISIQVKKLKGKLECIKLELRGVFRLEV